MRGRSSPLGATAAIGTPVGCPTIGTDRIRQPSRAPAAAPVRPGMQHAVLEESTCEAVRRSHAAPIGVGLAVMLDRAVHCAGGCAAGSARPDRTGSRPRSTAPNGDVGAISSACRSHRRADERGVLRRRVGSRTEPRHRQHGHAATTASPRSASSGAATVSMFGSASDAGAALTTTVSPADSPSDSCTLRPRVGIGIQRCSTGATSPAAVPPPAGRSPRRQRASCRDRRYDNGRRSSPGCPSRCSRRRDSAVTFTFQNAGAVTLTVPGAARALRRDVPRWSSRRCRAAGSLPRLATSAEFVGRLPHTRGRADESTRAARRPRLSAAPTAARRRLRWVGRCPECQAWGTVAEAGAAPRRSVSAGPVTRAGPRDRRPRP